MTAEDLATISLERGATCDASNKWWSGNAKRPPAPTLATIIRIAAKGAA
jgi:hypothetical protein